MAVDSDWITRYRQQMTTWLNALEDLLALRTQYDSLDYGNTLTEEDFAGANQDLTREQLTAAISSIEAIDTFTQAGHYTNLYHLKQ